MLKYLLLFSVLLFISCIIDSKKEETVLLGAAGTATFSSSSQLTSSFIQDIEQARLTVTLLTLFERLGETPLSRGVMTITWSDGTVMTEEITSAQELAQGKLLFDITPKNSDRFSAVFVPYVQGVAVGEAKKSSILPKGNTDIPLTLMIDNSAIVSIVTANSTPDNDKKVNVPQKSSSAFVRTPLSSSSLQRVLSSVIMVSSSSSSSEMLSSSQSSFVMESSEALSSSSARDVAVSSEQYNDCPSDEYTYYSILIDCAYTPTNYKTLTLANGGGGSYPNKWPLTNTPYENYSLNDLPTGLHNAFTLHTTESNNVIASYRLSANESPDMSEYTTAEFWVKLSAGTTNPGFYIQHAYNGDPLSYDEDWPSIMSWFYIDQNFVDNAWHLVQANLAENKVYVDNNLCTSCAFKDNFHSQYPNIFSVEFFTTNNNGGVSYSIGALRFSRPEYTVYN